VITVNYLTLYYPKPTEGGLAGFKIFLEQLRLPYEGQARNSILLPRSGWPVD
jgi:hypothetical protein